MSSKGYVFSNVEVQITNRCNFMCKNCIKHSGPYRTDVISTSTIQEVMKNIGNIADRIIISGGEPILYMEVIEEIASLCINSRVYSGYPRKICLQTNGYWAESDEKVKEMLYKLKTFGISEITLPGKDELYDEFIEDSKLRNIIDINNKNKIIDKITREASNMSSDNSDLDKFFCKGTEEYLLINVYGDIHPCKALGICYLGSIKDDNWRDALDYEFVKILKNKGIVGLINQYNSKFNEDIRYDSKEEFCRVCRKITSEWKRRT